MEFPRMELRKSVQREPEAASQKLNEECVAPLGFSLEELRGTPGAALGVGVEPVSPLDEEYSRFGARCLVLRQLLTLKECEHLIRGFESSVAVEPLRYTQDYRRCERAVAHSEELAGLLWARSKGRLGIPLAVRVGEDYRVQHPEGAEPGEPPVELQLGYSFEGLWEPVGLNECFRFCRYRPGGFFRQHCDGGFQRSEDERPLFTCVVYLDGGFEGGSTRFLPIDLTLDGSTYLQPAAPENVVAEVRPEPGLCLPFFQKGLLHEGEDLQAGQKHILRTEVMFRRRPESKPARTEKQIMAWDYWQQATKAESDRRCQEATELYRKARKLDPHLERLV